jgi:hypothetical protein
MICMADDAAASSTNHSLDTAVQEPWLCANARHSTPLQQGRHAINRPRQQSKATPAVPSADKIM